MRTFKEAVIAELGWREARVVERLFRSAVLPRHQPILWLLWPFRQRLFREDLAVMEKMLALSSYNDVAQLAREFGHPHRDLTFWRDRVGVRPRGRRLLETAKRVLVEPQRPRRAAPAIHGEGRAG
ncbi:MAG: hypothetical protein ACKOET_18495 [Verrucomicrobiota bacterium]